MLKLIVSLLSLCSLLLPMLSHAASWQAHSGDKQIVVMELFTAEGCGLCPAADRWVEALPEAGIGDERLIVLNFHIDYLDEKKAWIDRFASPVFSERQRQLSRLNLFQTVFTPEFFISGEVLHMWREHGIEAIDFVNSFEPEASISLRVDRDRVLLNIAADITVTGDENRQYSKLYLAVVEDNLHSEIHGGDNIGAVFNHQNTVRRWLGPFDLNADGQTHIATSLPVDREWKMDDVKLVAVVQNLYDGYILQGLSLPLSD